MVREVPTNKVVLSREMTEVRDQAKQIKSQTKGK
jgi:hypothetical protein